MRALFWRIILALRLVPRHRVPVRYRPLTREQLNYLVAHAPCEICLDCDQVRHDWLEMHAPPGLCG